MFANKKELQWMSQPQRIIYHRCTGIQSEVERLVLPPRNRAVQLSSDPPSTRAGGQDLPQISSGASTNALKFILYFIPGHAAPWKINRAPLHPVPGPGAEVRGPHIYLNIWVHGWRGLRHLQREGVSVRVVHCHACCAHHVALLACGGGWGVGVWGVS